MSPSEDPSSHPENQGTRKAAWRKRPTRRPRRRVCLLKGCTQRYRPDHPLERYCSDACRGEAERWRRWKAQQTYRTTEAGMKKRQAQSLRRRERRKSQKATSAAAASGARVIALRIFSAPSAESVGDPSADRPLSEPQNSPSSIVPSPRLGGHATPDSGCAPWLPQSVGDQGTEPQAAAPATGCSHYKVSIGTPCRPKKPKVLSFSYLYEGASAQIPPTKRISYDHSCDRPGCYQMFALSKRSPLQRFCSHDCRRALERVLERERRWRERGEERAWACASSNRAGRGS